MNVTEHGVPAGELITLVKSAITRAGVVGAADGHGLRVVSAQLTLQAVATTSAGGGLDFCVPVLGFHVDLGAKTTDHRTHTIEMTLVPRAQAATSRAAVADEVADVLVDAISTIRATMVAADGGGDPWALSTATVTLCFGVTRSGSISVGVDGSLERESSNTLLLTLRDG